MCSNNKMMLDVIKQAAAKRGGQAPAAPGAARAGMGSIMIPTRAPASHPSRSTFNQMGY